MYCCGRCKGASPMLLNAILLWSLTGCAARVVTSNSSYYDSFEFNCLQAKSRDNDLDFCHMVHWNAASAFNKSTFSDYYPGDPLEIDLQDLRAHDFYFSMATKSGSSPCRQAVKRLACAMFFPECPVTASSTSGVQSFPLCRLQCLQAENFCNEDFDCDGFTSENCMIFLPTGYFLLDPAQGPYDNLPGVYSACLIGWAVIAFLWHLGAFYLYKDSSVIICKAIATMPLLKVIVMALGTSFWTTCEEWMMCSFWLGVSVINTHLVFETGLIICFLLIAKGWSITRENFSANEWRGVIISMSAFYMCNSIILVLEASVLTQQGYWIACAILYGIMYIYILQSVLAQLKKLRWQVRLLTASGEVPVQIGGPLRSKYRMYLIFLFLVFCNMSLEVILHALLAIYGKMWIVLTVYEICDLIICGSLFFVFRPRNHSPFFFMVPASLNDNRTRPIPIIEATEDGQDSAEVEISPLLGHRTRGHGGRTNDCDFNDKMVIVRNPGGDIVVGRSPAMESRSHHGGNGFRLNRSTPTGYTPTSQVDGHDNQLPNAHPETNRIRLSLGELIPHVSLAHPRAFHIDSNANNDQQYDDMEPISY